MQAIFASQPHLWQWVNELPGSAGVRLFTEWAQELDKAAERMHSLDGLSAVDVLSLVHHLDGQHVRPLLLFLPAAPILQHLVLEDHAASITAQFADAK